MQPTTNKICSSLSLIGFEYEHNAANGTENIEEIFSTAPLDENIFQCVHISGIYNRRSLLVVVGDYYYYWSSALRVRLENSAPISFLKDAEI